MATRATRPRPVFTRHAFRTAALFAGAGLLSRFAFRYFETRWQIVIFWCLVPIYQLGIRPLRGKRISPASTALDLGVVALAITAMKVAIEGRL